MNLCQWLQNSWNDFVLDDLLLAIFLHRQVRNGSYNISKNFFFCLVVKKLEKNLEEALFAQVPEDVLIFCEIAH